MALDRRQFLKQYAAASIGLVSFGTVGPSATAHANTKPQSKSEWMKAVITGAGRPGKNRKAADSPLHLGRFRDPVYFLLSPISWTPNADQTGKFDPVEVPAGFVTDLASIPQPFWSLLRPDDDYAYAAIIHDYLYWTQSGSRPIADEILRLTMQDFQVSKWKMAVIFRAVSSKGGNAWNANAALKSKGEKRILKQFPPSATVRWQEWKSRPDVFVS